ncbi:hypothetical protein [Streptomyces sp. NPDC004528]|uniref:hypothetical protein n=1 Tax=Streptomyces sp. NPDC004528 TaxID=3154550 RepID=UPI0033ABC0CC
MDTSEGTRLEALLADFAGRYVAVARARVQLRTLSVTAQSRDGVVEATVDAGGGAPTIRFTGKRCGEMPAADLAQDILDALATARAEAATRVDTLTRDADAWPPVRTASAAGSVPGTRGTSTPSAPPDAGHRPGTVGPAAEERPVTCWGRMVREARTVAAGHASGPDGGTAGTGAGSGGRRTPKSAPAPPRRTGPPAQGPLWGGQRGLLPGPGAAPLPEDLRLAVIALGDAVCASAGCSCLAAEARPGGRGPRRT